MVQLNKETKAFMILSTEAKYQKEEVSVKNYKLLLKDLILSPKNSFLNCMNKLFFWDRSSKKLKKDKR